MKRIAAVAAVAMAALGLMSAPASAARADHGDRGPEPISQWLSAPVNRSTWVDVFWRTDRRVCDAKVFVYGGASVEIGYPSNTAHFTSFYGSDELRRGEVARTSFKVTPHGSGPSWTLLPATITFNDCGGGHHSRAMAKSTGFLLSITGTARKA